MLITYNTALVAGEGRAEEVDGPHSTRSGRARCPSATRVQRLRRHLGRADAKLYGWDYFKKLELNKPHIGRSVNDTVTMLNAKESSVAAVPSATTLGRKDKGNPLAVVYPEDGALLMISPSAIVKNAPRRTRPSSSWSTC